MQKYFLLLILFFSIIPAQRRPEFRPGGNLTEVDYFIIKNENNWTCNILYKISYSNLYFTKSDKQYKSKVSFAVELKDSVSNKYLRDFKEKEIIVDDFESTKLKDHYATCILTVEIDRGLYKASPSILSGQGSPLGFIAPFKIDNQNPDPLVIKPILLDGNIIKINENLYPGFVNKSGRIPFTHKKLRMLVPVYEKNINEINVEFIQDRESILNKKVEKSLYAKLDFKDFEEEIALDTTSGKPVKYFVIDDFNSRLTEGNLRVIITLGSNNKYVKNYDVVWFEKPLSLNNFEIAEKAIAVIDQADDFNKVNKNDEYRDVFNFWKKFDPTPDTEFNELMEEFYKRVDFGLREYSEVNNNNPVISDRAKVYIKYGSPDEVSREYNRRDETIEIWFYKKLNKKFYFTDLTGRGDYQLVD